MTYLRYPSAAENLRRNGGRLVTVYDLHETMSDAMHLLSLGAVAAASRTAGSPAPRGVSLFAHVPDDRTCEHAGIPAHYCACKLLEQVPVTDHR